jgi:hypothetical protein
VNSFLVDAAHSFLVDAAHSFLVDAAHIFEVAKEAARYSNEPEDLTIRIDQESGIRVITGPDYSYSSGTTYRVRRGQGRVVVEGNSGIQSCKLQTDIARRGLFLDRPAYLLM